MLEGVEQTTVGWENLARDQGDRKRQESKAGWRIVEELGELQDIGEAMEGSKG